ncbi:MAG: hypothetical protein IJA97_02355 [Clostridia bacterium]|nr:hypothetical protein [Clostridia bacterium]
MAFYSSFKFAPGEWFPFKDREFIDNIVNEDVNARQGKNFENPDFELKVVFDVHNYFAIDLMQRIRLSDVNNEKLVVILPTPENATYISLAEAINSLKISCRNVHVFFLNEYANEKGEVAPWQSPYSKSGQFMNNFYNRLDDGLKMPIENIHFWTSENVESYSNEIEKLGGADVCYTYISWAGGLGVIDVETFKASSIDELKGMTSRLVTPALETIAQDSLRGMFGFSGDISSVPPKAVTVGPKDLLSAKEWIDLEYLVGCAGTGTHQKFPIRLALFGPLCPENPASLMRLSKGTCYVCPEVAEMPSSAPDFVDLIPALEKIAQKEGK